MGIVFTTSKKIKALETEIESLKIALYNEQISSKRKLEELNKESVIRVNTVKKQAEEAIRQQKIQNEAAIIQIREYVESRRDVLEAMDEKSLLIDVVLALEGYGSRLNRLEARMSVDSIIKKLDLIADSFNSKTNQMTSSLLDNIKRMSTVVQNSTDELQKNINEKLEGYDIVNSLKTISDKLGDEFDYGSLLYFARSAAENTEEIESVAKECKDELWWIKSAAEDAKSAAEDAKSAAEDAKVACESNSF